MYTIESGKPEPLGATITPDGINFSLFSKHATHILLCIIDPNSHRILYEFTFDAKQNRTGQIWHMLVKGLELPIAYGYKIHGPLGSPHFFDKQHLLSDPYAKAMISPPFWGGAPLHPHSYLHYSLLLPQSSFDWEQTTHPRLPLKDLIIYEMHVRGFTKHPSSQVSHPGSYQGLIEKIPHLIDLGINAVELMPIYEFNECEYHRLNPETKERLYNYWGYSTVNFFSPMNRYASSSDFGASITEFKQLVKELHRNGIEVILDVVFNHTADKKKKAKSISFMGIDRCAYYILDENGNDMDFTGCGHTMNVNHPVMARLIIDCLHYWVTEMKVDGFRFDLASVMQRDMKGTPQEITPLIEALTHDPILADTKLIAEPWDANGLYQVGAFYPKETRWCEWNGKYRDSIRRFIKGDAGSKNEFATRISGSEDLYSLRSPQASINFITAHDGFSLRDLVSYNQKHNLPNAENNRDGNSYNISWNCGVEGETNDPKIQQFRLRQIKNFLLSLMLSQGVPMILMGDEYGHTCKGNNNPWCQDNAINWFDWDELKKNDAFFKYIKRLIRFRKETPIFQKETFLGAEELVWHGLKPNDPQWDNPQSFIAFTLENKLYAAFNATNAAVTVTLPNPVAGKKWQLVVDTSKEIADQPAASPYKMQPYSSLLLIIV